MMPIPRVFHRVWLGPEPMPPEFVNYGKSWVLLHPGWEFRLWTDKNLFVLENQQFFERATTYSEKSDFVRHELLRNYGGVYIDTDFEALKCIKPLIDRVEAFAGSEDGSVFSMGILGAVPNHPAFQLSVRALGTPPFPRDASASANTGPAFITKVWRSSAVAEAIRILPPKLVYPWPFGTPRTFDDPRSAFPEAYAIHYWAHSWKSIRSSGWFGIQRQLIEP